MNHAFRRHAQSRWMALLWVVGFALSVSACAQPKSPTQIAWLPDATGWNLRDFDDTEPPQWVLCERDALIADVKEFRIVGVVDAEPEVAVGALRYRLLDEQYVPEGLQRRTLKESELSVSQDAVNVGGPIIRQRLTAFLTDD